MIQKIVKNAPDTLGKEKITNELYELIETKNKGLEVLRGQIYLVDFQNNTIGSEQGGVRPALVFSNNMGNKFGPTIVVIAITTQMEKANNIPAHVYIDRLEYNTGLSQNSIALTEQIRTVDKKRIISYIGECPYGLMKRIEKAFKIEFDIDPVDIVDFIEYFAKKRNVSNRLKIALANDMAEYFSDQNINYKNNVTVYVNQLKWDEMDKKVIPLVANC
jgi:mRNA interferase MazF